MSGEITLRALEARDLPIRVAWMNDVRINATLNIQLPVTLAGTQAWFTRVCENPARADFAFEDATGEVVAMGGFTDIDSEVKKAELYIFVSPELKGRGIGSRVVSLMCAHAFSEMGLEKVYLNTNADNAPARKVYEKCGFALEGVLRREVINNGKIKDRLRYAIYSTPPIVGQNFQVLQREFFLCHDMKLSGRNIKIVRDDLFPGIGGGNKARKAAEYEREFFRCGIDALVTTGGIQSNHNRAMAALAAKNGWECHIVYHGSRERFESGGGNAALVRVFGATAEFVEADQISGAMDAAMERFRRNGKRPYYVTGGGHDSPGGNAYVNAVAELYAYGEMNAWKPDVIFHASGTGSTQAGILVGLEKVGWGDVKVIGISVARQEERGAQAVSDFTKKLAVEHGISPDVFNGRIRFCADFLCGGYEKYSGEMKIFLEKTIRETGIVFDTTYSGKALFGMSKQLEQSDFRGNALFWHTGGVMNFLAGTN
ncbi:MAG: pyridoxal-phosphate dependent enzyme [Opitutales bacterium]|nr:pyridoxal-phosphate dependent enzyme [Opitutales bacterium]